MSCGADRERISLYLDGRLPAGELARMHAHLEGCEACRREKEALEAVDSLVGAAFVDHPFGEACVEAILEKLPLAAAPPLAPARPIRFRPLGIGLAAAAAGLLVALSLSLLRQEETGAEGLASASPPAAVGRAGVGLRRVDDVEGLSARTRIRSGDRLLATETPASIRLDDGTLLELYAETEVELSADPDGGLTVHLRGAAGRVFCEVAKRQHPFRVRARGLEVRVLGTRFLVEQRPRVSRVVVVEGRVLAVAGADRHVLEADREGEVFPGEPRPRLNLSPVTARRHILWIPRVAEEQRHIDRARVRQLEESKPGPPPAKPVKPKTPPAKPTLDKPVLPPRKTGEKQGYLPPADW
jgi:ferric-dicitrate binding protein FerR (iron transport regulator)